MKQVIYSRPGGFDILGERTAPGVPVYVAAGLSLLAALVHLWLLPGQLAESPARGTLLAAFVLFQGFYGVWLLRWPSKLLLALGTWGNLAVVSLYAVERVSVMSFAPHGERMGGYEMVAVLLTAAELGLLLGLLLGASRAVYAAEALSFGAALVHLWEAQGRYGEWWGFVAFFLVIGLAQGLYCLGLPYFGGRISFLLAGVVGNLSIVAIWALTRVVGIPYVRTHGIEGSELRIGKTEGVGGADLAATTVEVALIAVLATLAVGLLAPRTGQEPWSREGETRI